jgi:molecular chaperone DnaJ/curved DNA-binding protein
MAEDFYKTLGVNRNASQADIQKAYRELARKYHPDMNPDDKTAKKRFQQIQTAFDVLNDSKKREMYDRYGSSFENFGPGGPRGSTWTFRPGEAFSGSGFEDIDFMQFFGDRFDGQPGFNFSDLFSQARGGGKRAGAARSAPGRKGADLEHELTIPFTTSITGGEAQISVQRPQGKTETIQVKIPAGIEDGKKIRLRGQGGAAPAGGPSGDLLIKIHVAPHPSFQRRGNNLVVRVPVTVAEAALGAKVDVPTPRGTVTLRVPPGTSSGSKLRIKEHGVQPKRGQAGDLLAEILIVLPDQLDPDSMQLIRQFDEKQNRAENPRANLRW